MQILRIILIVCFAFTAYPSSAISLPDQILPVIPNYAERTMYQELQLEAKELDIEIEKMTAPAGENSFIDGIIIEARDGEELGVMESEGERLLRNGAPSVIEKTMTAPAGENSLEMGEEGSIKSKTTRLGETPSGGGGEMTHLNERILQLQKKCIKLRKRFNKDICRGDKECMTNVDECKSLKTQSKELDKSLDTPTEDDGY